MVLDLPFHDQHLVRHERTPEARSKEIHFARVLFPFPLLCSDLNRYRRVLTQDPRFPSRPRRPRAVPSHQATLKTVSSNRRYKTGSVSRPIKRTSSRGLIVREHNKDMHGGHSSHHKYIIPEMPFGRLNCTRTDPQSITSAAQSRTLQDW